MTLWNKDLLAKINILLSLNHLIGSHGSLVGLEKGEIFNFFAVFVCLIASRYPTYICIPNKLVKDIKTKDCVEPGSINALANKVWIQRDVTTSEVA